MTPVIETIGLAKRYRRVTALCDCFLVLAAVLLGVTFWVLKRRDA